MKTTEMRLDTAKGFVGSDAQWGVTHVLSETVWRLSDLLLEVAAEVDPHADDPDASGVYGFHRQAALIAYAAELKNAAALTIEATGAAEGGQCRAYLADIERAKRKAEEARGTQTPEDVR